MATSRAALDDRKAAILQAIVSHYVRSGEPVGSKTLVDRFRLGVSPATVRNEMGALEDAGYIYQPHTSAGRIPTDAGYRYFVDAWGADARLPAQDARRVERFFGEPRWELEEALRRTASLLSNLTDHAAVVFAPVLDRSLVRHVELVRLSAERAMLVVVTETGRVSTHVVAIPESVDEPALEEASAVLNESLAGTPLENAVRGLEGAVERLPEPVGDSVASLRRVLTDELEQHESERVFLEGTSNIVDEQKFADLEVVRQVIGALERRRLLLELLADALGAGRVFVRIGAENPAEEMHYCSIVTAPYGLGGSPVGSLAVVGPTRMDYRRTIAAVHEVSAALGRMLDDLGA